MFQKFSTSLLCASALASMAVVGAASAVQAQAAPVIEYSLNGGSTFTTLANPSGNSTIADGSLGSFAITNLSALSVNSSSIANLNLGMSSISFAATPGSTASNVNILFQASQNGFTFDPSGINSLEAAGSATLVHVASSTGDTLFVKGGSDAGNNLFTYTTTSNPSGNPFFFAGSPTSGTKSSSFGTDPILNPSINSTGYSLTSTLNFTSFYVGDMYNNPSSTVTVSSSPAAITAGPAVPLPPSGLLTLVGGLALVGGVAIRRRMKA